MLKIRKLKIKKLAFWALFLPILAVGLWSFYNYQKLRKQVTKLNTIEGQQELAKEQFDEMLAKVAKHIVLPKDEEPNIVVVKTEIEKLVEAQPFYKGVENGDRLIIYPEAQKVYLYSVSRDVLLNVGTTYIEENQVAGKKEKEKINIEVRNGTKTLGKGTKLANELEENENYNITNVETAAKDDYGETILVDLTRGSKAGLVIDLEKRLGVEAVEVIPNDELDTLAEVLIIVGE
jgi:hypothetical protein